jgi:hypothetical protein
MALDIHLIKNTSKESIVSVSGANDTATVTLTSLVSADQVLGASGSSGYAAPTVNVAAVITSGNINGAVSLRRGATGATGHLVFVGSPENAPAVQFNQYGFTEDGQNASNILVTHGGATGALATTWIVLHKQGGYYAKVEYEQYGAYDDETAVGALDIVGSPGYTP